MEEQIIRSIFEGGYGTVGGVLVFLFYFLKQTNLKLDKIIDMNNKVFSLTLTLVDPETRVKSITDKNITKKGF